MEQRPCKNKSSVAKGRLGCTIAIYSPILNATSFPGMKHVMWPAAGVDKVQDHAKERERRVTTNFSFVLACLGCCSVVAWTRGIWSRAQLLHSPSIFLEPNLASEQDLVPGKPAGSQTGYICHLSTQNWVWLISVTSL